MTKRTFLLLVLGLSACLCWAIASTVADDQPGARPDASTSVSQATAKAGAQAGKVVPNEARRVAPTTEQVGRAGTGHVQTMRSAERFGATERHGGPSLMGGTSRSGSHQAVSAKPQPVVVPRSVPAADRDNRGGSREVWSCTDLGAGVYSQPLDDDNFSTARTSDEQAGIAVAEDLVTALTAPVTTVRFWGISLEFDPTVPGFVAACNQDDLAGTEYIFKFYAAGAGGPGIVKATRTAAPTIVDTGVNFNLGANIMQYTATMNPPVCHTDVAWISIQRKTGAHAANGNPCYFLWVDEDLVGTYNDQAYQDELVETDQTMCIGVFAGSTVGACCNESGAPFDTPQGEIPNFGCLPGVDLCDCAEPGLRFSTGDCETGFTPGCGFGACCYLDGEVRTCVEVTQDECTTLGGYRFHIGEECPEDISIYCYPPPANDTCATAIDYTACPMPFDSTGAETDVIVDDPPVDLGFQPQNDVYFKYQVPASAAYNNYESGLVVITTYDSDFDTCIVCYTDVSQNDCPNFDCENLQILGAPTQPQAVNDDMVSAERYTSIARVNVSLAGSVQPEDCILIRVAGLPPASSATPPGGQGTLRVDFVPFADAEYNLSAGVCCKATGCEILQSLTAAPDCRAAGGWFRPYTDFLQGAAAPEYDELAAGTQDVPQLAGCCATYPCEQGDFAGKPYVLPTFTAKDVPVTLTVNRHNVTYFMFQTPLVLGETNAISIDTCGTPFDTILSIYRYNQPTDLDDAGDVHGDAEVGDEYTETPLFRNDNCWGVDPQASCFSDPDSLDSCMCLTVGQIDDDLATTTWYIAKVGMKDERALESGYVRADGIDPVPNWPYDANVPVTIKLTWHDECTVCLTECCKGDLDNSEMADMADVPVFVDAVLRRGAFAGGLDCDQWEFCTADMNNDYKVNGEDIEDFMFAVIYGWDCTPDPINCEDEDPDYCQNRDGNTFRTTDLKTDGEDHYVIADNFSSLSGGYINQICWWGVFMTFDGGWTGDCGPGTGAFRITYFNDAGGVPGTVKAGPYAVTPTITQLDPLNFGTFTAYEYLMDATHPLVGIGRDECIWVEITADNGSGNCYFLWESSWPGDEWYFQDADGDGYQITDRDVGDQAFCVNALLNQFACLDTECDPECPGGSAIIEGEIGALDPCSNEGHVDTVDGGCNSDPVNPPLKDITCDSIVCGTAGTWTQLEEIECEDASDCPDGAACTGGICEGGPYPIVYRDTDWYKLHLTEEQEVTLTVATGDVDFPYVIGFVTGTDCSDPNLAISPYASKLPCQPATVQACLPGPADYWIFFAPRSGWLIGCEREYIFSVECRDCPYCQYPNGSWVSISDDARPNWNADNFRPSEPGGVTSTTWYGCNMDPAASWAPCTFTQETYTLRFYLDDGSGSQGYAGLPGSLLAEIPIGSNFTKEDTGSLFIDAPIYKYTAMSHTMVPVNAGQCYWVSVVQDAPDQGNCMYTWHSNSPASDGQGDGISATSGDSGDTWEPSDAEVGEFAYCVNVAAEAEGCGVDIAACCIEDGSCIGDMSEFYCTMQGGTWHEGESCDTFTCPQPVTCYTNSLTQLNNPNLLEDMPYSCAIHEEEHNVDNFFARSYTHGSRWVNCVHFGVWSTLETPIVMRTRIYKDANAGLPDNSMTLVATSQTPIPPNTSNTFFTAYFSPSAYVTSGGKAVYEHYYPESDAYLFIGANTAGVTLAQYHTYWKSPCTDNGWIDMQDYDPAPAMADWQLVQRVRWSTTQ